MPTTSTVAQPIVAGCIDACGRCLSLIRSLPPGQYAAQPPGQSSIGAHMRHAIEHFVCFFEGLERGEVNYDARERDPVLESSPDAATGALNAIRAGLTRLPGEVLPVPIGLRLVPTPGAEEAVVSTTIERELAFLASHAIHHVALAALTAALLGLSVDPGLALAVSTGEHLGR